MVEDDDESVGFSSITTGDSYLRNHTTLLLDQYGEGNAIAPQEVAGVDGAADSSASEVPPDGAQQHVYGRNAETAALIQAYERLLVTKQAQTVLVHGKSGSGKTTLVDVLRELVCCERPTSSYFVTGKFFQLDANAPGEPYSAIMAAFSDLCDLIVQSNDHDENQQQQIKGSLGSDAQILVKSISNLSSLIGAMGGIEPMEASSFAQFKVACRTFLRSVASEKHPVVMFLDDIQWADEGSIQLIQMFLGDDDDSSTLDNVMFVVAYRDEEAEHVFESGMLDNLNDPTDIQVASLNAGAVHQIVISTLGSDTAEIKKLSDLVTRRTLGNPMHVTMFMEAIQREGLLTYDDAMRSWNFDVAELQREIMVSDTLANLLTRKIDCLSSVLTCNTLKVASLLGYAFSELILLKVVTCMIAPTGESIVENSAMLAIAEAIKEGFIEKTSGSSCDTHHFSHDKIQSAFKSMISESDGPRLHLLIGKAYLSAHEQGGDGSNMYRAAVHLSWCEPAFANDREGRIRLAQINLAAAKYCKEISAFEQAVATLQAGIKVLGPLGKWADAHFALTFELAETLAKMQLVIGDLEASRATVLEALRHTKTSEMRVKLLVIDVEVRTVAGDDVRAVVETANRGLSDLGFKIPRRIKLRHWTGKIVKVTLMLSRKTDDDLLNLPLTQDLVIVNVVKLLIRLYMFCVTKMELGTAIFSALLAAELSLKHGLCQYSPCAFVIYGVSHAAIGRVGEGYRFGRLAQKMLDRMPSRDGEGPTVAYALGLLVFWKEPLNQLVEPMHVAAKSAFQYGDIFYGIYCMYQYHAMQLTNGEHLADVELSIRATYGRIYSLGQDELLRWLQPILQYVINLQADVANWENIAVMTGEAMDEEAYLNEVAANNQQELFSCLYSTWKTNAAVHFGEYILAESVWESCRANDVNIDQLQHTWVGPSFHFNQALIAYGLFEITGKSRYWRAGRKKKRRLQRLHTAGCPNATPFFVYLVAHDMSLQRNKYSLRNASELRAAFISGVDCLKASGHSYLEGLLCERAAFYFLALGMRVYAESYFDRALRVYQNDWGATAKFNQLQHISGIALSQIPHSTSENTLQLTGMSISVPFALEK